MLILKNIYKKYNSSKNYVVKNININFEDKGLVCILGASGSGKSTLLNIICGIDEPTKGEVFIDRTSINTLKKENKLYNNYVGIVFQNYNLIKYLNVEDNIRLFSNRKASNLLRSFNIRNKEKVNIESLSGGQKQRVAIARTLFNDKKIILCDEPTGALDHSNSEKVMRLLKKLSKNKLVIVVTHNEELANKYANRIIRIKDGKIIYDSNPLDIKERNRELDIKKEHISMNQIFKQVINNIKNQRKKNVFKMISLVVSMISLLLVLSISKGFNYSIELASQNELATMPIYISKTSLDITKEFNDFFKDKDYDKNYIYIRDLNHINKLDTNFIKYIDNLMDYSNIIRNILINNIYLSLYDKSIEKDIDLLGGKIPETNKEILLMIDSNNSIDDNTLDIFDNQQEKIDISSIVGYKIDKRYKITGIARFKEDSPMYENTGLYTINKNYKEIPEEIYIYPLNVDNKKYITDYLDKYNDLEYMDYSDTTVSVSKTIISSISIILIVFSLISIIVSSLMNYILTFISIDEAIKTIGIYIVNGVNKRIIKLIYYLENIFISIIATMISIFIVSIISLPINSLLDSLIGLKNVMLITPITIINAMSLSLFITLISIYFPIKKINKLKLVDILKYN